MVSIECAYDFDFNIGYSNVSGNSTCVKTTRVLFILRIMSTGSLHGDLGNSLVRYKIDDDHGIFTSTPVP